MCGILFLGFCLTWFFILGIIFFLFSQLKFHISFAKHNLDVKAFPGDRV